MSHTVGTLSSENPYIPYQDYVLNLSVATADIQHFILSILTIAGAFGNTIFFMCSAWFLLDSRSVNKKKMWQMLLEIWAVSVLIFAISYFLRSGDIDTKILIKQFFPTIFANNWYLTCYLLFYPIHPILNGIIYKMSQKELLRVNIALLTLYIGFNYVWGGLFFISSLILWGTIYFAIAYMKLYLPDLTESVKFNAGLLLIGVCGHLFMISVTNILGLRITRLYDNLLYWNSSSSPFLMITTVALLNFARKATFKNRFINRLSGLSLLIYIIHENMVLRTYYRPWIINYVYEHFGYQYILGWVFIIAAGIFVWAACMAFLYEWTIGRAVAFLGNKMYPCLANAYRRLEERLLMVH